MAKNLQYVAQENEELCSQNSFLININQLRNYSKSSGIYIIWKWSMQLEHLRYYRQIETLTTAIMTFWISS